MGDALTSRQKQAAQTKRRIIEAALKLIEQKPISDIRIQDITGACGIAAGTFYHYFSSKEELCARIALEPDTPALMEIKRDSSLPLMERLRGYLTSRARTVEREGLSVTRNIHQFRMTASYREIRDKLFDGGHFEFSVGQTLFRDAVESGELSADFPVDFYAQMLVYTIQGIIFNECLYDEPPRTVAWVSRFLDYLEQVALKPYLLK